MLWSCRCGKATFLLRCVIFGGIITPGRCAPSAACGFYGKSPVKQKNLFTRRFFVLEGNIAGYWCDINTVRVIKRTAKGDDEGCSH